MDQTTLIGTTGAFLILVAFVMNQLNKWRSDWLVYDAVNLVGSAFLVLYAYILKSYPFLVLNGVWALVSLRDVVVELSKNSKRKERNFFKKWFM